MGTYVDDEGHVYRTDRADRVLAVETDHPQELADALETLGRELLRTRDELHAWKWAVIAAHNAVQNIVADCAAGERTRERKEMAELSKKESKAPNEAARRDAFTKRLAKMWELIWKGEELVELHSFLHLFDLVNERWRLPVHEGLRDRMAVLNDVRNRWIHFGAGRYEFEVDDYPSLILDCVEWVEYLGWSTGLVFWFSDAVKDRARAHLNGCLGILKELKAEYSE